MAKTVTKVYGIDTVMANINKEVVKIQGRTVKGMLQAASFIRVQTETKPPVVPEEFGDLKGSWVQGPAPTSTVKIPVVEAGYTADYAAYVHEMPRSNDWTTPGSGPKWLEIHFKRNTQKVLHIIANAIKTK